MILSHMQIEEIAAAVTKDFNEFFFGKNSDIGRTTARATPIDQFAKDYLGLSVSFAHLSSDGSLCGLTAYADTEYTIEEQGVKRTIPLKANQILLDLSFIQPRQVHALCGKRRFTLAHECAHQILFGMESDNDKRTHESKYAPRAAYSLRDLKTREDWNEWQANDFEQNTITIRHTVTSCDLDGKCVLVASDTTKTKSSMRTLPLVPFMRERLFALKEEQQENRRLCGRSYIKDHIGYVCVNEIGDLIKPHYVTESFPKLLKANGLRHIRYHDLRHSCASRYFWQTVFP